MSYSRWDSEESWYIFAHCDDYLAAWWTKATPETMALCPTADDLATPEGRDEWLAKYAACGVPEWALAELLECMVEYVADCAQGWDVAPNDAEDTCE